MQLPQEHMTIQAGRGLERLTAPDSAKSRLKYEFRWGCSDLSQSRCGTSQVKGGLMSLASGFTSGLHWEKVSCYPQPKNSMFQLLPLHLALSCVAVKSLPLSAPSLSILSGQCQRCFQRHPFSCLSQPWHLGLFTKDRGFNLTFSVAHCEPSPDCQHL